MSLELAILLTGLALGALYGAVALGLVVTYKGTGVINFAAGAMGAWSAFVYSDLHAQGVLQLPLAGVPSSIRLSHDGLSTLPALAIAVVYGALLGLAVYLLVFRPLRDAPSLGRVVASIGVMLAVQALIVERFGSMGRSVDALLPSTQMDIAGVPVSQQVFWLAGIVLVLGLAVAAWFRWSRLGLAMRASAEDPLVASLAGFSPVLLGAMTWTGASAVVGFAAVAAAPSLGLNSGSYVLYVVPGLACALVGRLKAVVPAVIAGLVLGMIEAEVTFLATKTWWPSWANTGVTSAVPLLAIVVLLAVVGKSIPDRSDAEQGTLPRVPRPRVRPAVGVALVAVGLLALVFTHGTVRFGLITSFAFGIIALSIVLVTGVLGQVSLAQAAFAGIGGFAVAKLASGAGIGFPWAPILAALIAALFGVLCGLPALRIRGAHLAVVTLALAFACDQLIFNNSAVNSFTGNPVSGPKLPGLDLSIRGTNSIARLPFGIMCLLVLVLVALAVVNLTRSGTGRKLLAVRSNERASASVGVSVTRAKLLGFGGSAFLAGLGGSLLAYSQGSVSAESFATMVGVAWLAYVYLCGITSLGGALTAASVVTLGVVYALLDKFVGVSSSGYLLIAALGLIVSVIFNPEGVAGRIRSLAQHLPGVRLAGAAVGVAGVGAVDSVAAAAGVSVASDVVGVVDDGAVALRDGGGVVAGRCASRPPAAPQAASWLELADLSVRYGGVVAAAGVNLRVQTGQIVGLIGANGAGKTSVIDAASGFARHSGRVTLGGRALEGMSAHQRYRCGLARTWQSSELFVDLTVLENVQVACEGGGPLQALRDCVWPKPGAGQEEAAEWLDLFGLGYCASRLPTELTLGQTKLVSLARALGAGPAILMADEPAAGLSTSETAEFAKALRRVATEKNVGVLLVEHDVELVTELCDYVYVLDFGRIIAYGTPAEIRTDQNVISAYLGSAATADRAEVVAAEPGAAESSGAAPGAAGAEPGVAEPGAGSVGTDPVEAEPVEAERV
jgi:ABC-type branched-subunit amino acid transport system ATPase component/ABC-type branched-subunit amino acid transport system permease subunit